MAGRHDWLRLASGGFVERNVGGEDWRLTILGFAQLLFRALALQFQQVVAEHRCATFEDATRRPGVRRNVASHCDALRPLAGEHCAKPHYAAHLQATAPHERPPPKATNTIRSPGLTRPVRTVSESAIGMDAADVLPYSEILITTLSSGRPKYRAGAAMMLLLA